MSRSICASVRFLAQRTSHDGTFSGRTRESFQGRPDMSKVNIRSSSQGSGREKSAVRTFSFSKA